VTSIRPPSSLEKSSSVLTMLSNLRGNQLSGVSLHPRTKDNLPVPVPLNSQQTLPILRFEVVLG
jgi:hypothetical protein